MNKIYLDYNASTPIAEEVIDAMLPYLKSGYGNPSSTHWAGQETKEAIVKARHQVADLLSCDPEEVIFTSGGSEANNHALKGVFFAKRNKGNHIITTKVEHPAILNPCKFLETLGAEITYVDVDQFGKVNPEDIECAINDKTILISVMHANNEVGTIQPIKEIAKIAKKYNITFHTDASQSIGKIPTKVDELGVDLLTIAGHKLYAPKGVGALYIRKGTSIDPFIHGAGHEDGRRAGTENILQIVGLGKACELAMNSHNDIFTLRNYFWEELQSHFGDNVILNGNIDEILPNTLNVSFLGKIGQELLAQTPEIAASTGSACHSGSVQLSPVLEAMQVNETIGKGTIRFSLGRYTTKEEIDTAVALLKKTM
ncbi:cysteine desulfurase family protein [Bacillus sp. PS06]|uniref:cysteine desulfurase family protein n=1 Tax=Bacillus sp. PS06 TaxID=2764176 RepID=UPI001786FDD5|nr:cysteine desulfurase family protein [Bacillus sp. PS06]MBD8070819.1 cysteine desulfurase [Bacillus sp. PS06]